MGHSLLECKCKPWVIVSPPHTDASDRSYFSVPFAGPVAVNNIPSQLIFDVKR